MADGSGGYEKVQDYQVYWTASFYIAAARVPHCVRDVLLDRGALQRFYDRDAVSRRLADAINPLFNDIADRERSGKIDDFLFAVGRRKAEDRGADYEEVWIDLDMPDEVEWVTEGLTTMARPPEPMGAQKVRARRFWYVHRDGGLSWHVSFLLDYGPPQEVREKIAFDRSIGIKTEDFWHRPSLLYFLSRLQKALAPKEFALPGGASVDADVRVHRHRKGGTKIAPIDRTWVKQSDKASPLARLNVETDPAVRTLWFQFAEWFRRDADDFFEELCGGWQARLRRADPARADEVERDPFEALIGLEPFMEVPGLQMPRFRYMFFFVDYTFFNRLLPPLAEDGRRLMPRSLFVHENCYAPYLRKNQELTRDDRLDLDAGYWKWATTRDDTAQEAAKIQKRVSEADIPFKDWLTEYRKDKPAWRDDKRPDCLNYMFLSGFNQNIIDFMAQDASEILDSLDPIYPDPDDESAERFFIRYATPRGFLTYVSASRSLEAGNDHIGTCPYAFLIHVLALHNEYLARDYEMNTEEMIGEIRDLNADDKAGKAVERFYAFRTGEFSDYARNRYGRVFRYDTEAKVFEQVEQARGIVRKTEYLEVIVENLEKQTADLQSRLQKREDREVTYALGAVGAFGLFSLIFDLIGRASEVAKSKPQPWVFWALLGLTAAVVASIVIFLVRVLLRDYGEFQSQRRARRRAREAAKQEWRPRSGR